MGRPDAPLATDSMFGRVHKLSASARLLGGDELAGAV